MIDIPQPIFSLDQSVQVNAKEMYIRYQGWTGTVLDMTFSVLHNCWTYRVLFTRNGRDIWEFRASDLLPEKRKPTMPNPLKGMKLTLFPIINQH